MSICARPLGRQELLSWLNEITHSDIAKVFCSSNNGSKHLAPLIVRAGRALLRRRCLYQAAGCAAPRQGVIQEGERNQKETESAERVFSACFHLCFAVLTQFEGQYGRKVPRRAGEEPEDPAESSAHLPAPAPLRRCAR